MWEVFPAIALNLLYTVNPEIFARVLFSKHIWDDKIRDYGMIYVY